MKKLSLILSILFSIAFIYSCGGSGSEDGSGGDESGENMQSDNSGEMSWVDTLTPEAVEESYTNYVLGRAPEFKLYDTNRREITLEDYEGYMVLLSFWARENPPSLRLFPIMSEIHNEFRNDKFTVLGVCMDRATTENIQEYADIHRLSYPVVYPLNSQIYQNYNIQSPGEAVLIDRRGNVVGHFRQNPGKERIEKVIKLFIPQEK